MPSTVDHSIYNEEYFDNKRKQSILNSANFTKLGEKQKLVKDETESLSLVSPDRLTTWRRFLIGPVLFTYMAGYIMSYYIITEYTNSYEKDKFFRDANLTHNKTTDSVCRGVPEGILKVRRGWVWEGVSPSLTLEKKSRYELNGGFS